MLLLGKGGMIDICAFTLPIIWGDVIMLRERI